MILGAVSIGKVRHTDWLHSYTPHQRRNSRMGITTSLRYEFHLSGGVNIKLTWKNLLLGKDSWTFRRTSCCSWIAGNDASTALSLEKKS